MKKKIVALFLAVGLMCTGCGSKNNLAGDLARVSGNSIEDGQIAGSSNVEEKIVIKNNEDGNTYNINVNSTGYKNAKIYEAKPYIIDDEYLKNMATSLFDDGKYEVITLYELATEEELEKEEKYFTDLESKADDEIKTVVLHKELDRELNKEKQENAANKKDNGIIKSVVSDFDERDGFKLLEREIGEVTGYECQKAKLRGKIDGKPYELDYINLGGSATITLCDLTPNYNEIGEYAIGNQQIDDCILGETRFGDVENICNEETCRKQAKEFLKKIGCEDFSEVGILKRWKVSDPTLANILVDGYSLVYSREVCGVKTPFGYNLGVVLDKNEDNSKASKEINSLSENLDGAMENIVLEVDSSGIFRATIKKYFEIGECLSDKNNLMSFDKIQDILANTDAFGDYSIDYGEADVENSDNAKLNKSLTMNMEFGYIPVGNGESYAYIPVWVINCPIEAWSYTGTQCFPRNEFAINAIDGSIIYFSDEASVKDLYYNVSMDAYLRECNDIEKK